MRKNLLIIITLLVYSAASLAQDWTLKLSSNVELRTWKLSTKADKDEKSVQGATIMLYKGASMIGQTASDLNGDFVIDIPAHGEFILTVSYAGCNTKKFYVSTNGIPENVGKDNYKPTIVIGGFVMSKPITGVDYIGLSEPLVKVEYKTGGQNFDKDEAVTNNGLNIVSKINAAENTIIDKFCLNNKLGDEALNKKKCQLAKDYYLKARNLIPDEKYPTEQLEKAEKCLEAKKEEQEAIAAEAAKKAQAAKAASDKAKENKAAASQTTIAKTSGKSEAPPEKQSAPTHKVVRQKANLGESTAGKSKYKMPNVIGNNKYKEAICRADDFFKKKRYREAKSEYLEALKLKDKDDYANNRVSECNRLLTTEKAN